MGRGTARKGAKAPVFRGLATGLLHKTRGNPGVKAKAAARETSTQRQALAKCFELAAFFDPASHPLK